jgi:hypothetical protein
MHGMTVIDMTYDETMVTATVYATVLGSTKTSSLPAF